MTLKLLRPGLRFRPQRAMMERRPSCLRKTRPRESSESEPSARRGGSFVGADEVRGTVEGNRHLFDFCYQEGLKRNRFLQGRVAAKFEILPDGTVSGLTNGGSDFPGPEVISCVFGSFAGLRFVPPDQTVTVIIPLSFSTRPLPQGE